MVGARFNQLFRVLVARWTTWHAASREPERVPELAQARFDLEDARSAIAAERAVLISRAPRDGARTSVSPEDRARLQVLATGYQQN